METSSFRILVGTDFSDSAKLAVLAALEEAQRHQGSELHVVSVIDDGGHHLLPSDHHASISQTMDRVRDILTAETRASIALQPGPAAVVPFIHVRLGAIAEQLAGLATEIRADLLIVGTHGRRGIRRFMMGSVADRVVRLAPCPVLVVRPKNFHALDGLPAIEPPCPECVKEREKTGGAQWWCDEHNIRPEKAHTYSFSGRLTDPPSPRNHML